MATAFQGPVIAARTNPSGNALDYQQDLGPSAWFHGDMLLDPRLPYTYQAGSPIGTPTFGWSTGGPVCLIDQSPSTASATNIANAATATSGTPLVLVSSSGSGITVGCQLTNANTGALVTGLLGIDVSAARTVTGVFTNGSPKITFSGATMQGVQINDQITLTSSGTLPTPFALATTYYVNAIGAGAMMLSATPNGSPISATSAGSGTQTINVTATGGASGYYRQPTPNQPIIAFGQGATGGPYAGTGGGMTMWNPAWAIARTIVITTTGDDTGGFYTVAGYDVYGYPLTQKLTGVSSTTVSTTKAFKYITSVTPSGTINSTTASVGTNDVFGLPLRADYATSLLVYWNAALVTSTTTTGLTAADITTASASTGDVRGTITATATSDGTKRLTVYWIGQPENFNTTVGLIGQPQF